jgi:hypothetical protein
MDSEALEKSLEYGKDKRLLEATYQKEFYTAAVHLLGHDGVVSSEVGAFDTNGRLDWKSWHGSIWKQLILLLLP